MSDLELTMMRRVGELNKEVARLKAENARLKIEVEHLMVFCNCTLIPNKELQAKVERLTKAGDAMADDLLKEFGRKEMLKDDSYQNWLAAKEGKQP